MTCCPRVCRVCDTAAAGTSRQYHPRTHYSRGISTVAPVLLPLKAGRLRLSQEGGRRGAVRHGRRRAIPKECQHHNTSENRSTTWTGAVRHGRRRTIPKECQHHKHQREQKHDPAGNGMATTGLLRRRILLDDDRLVERSSACKLLNRAVDRPTRTPRPPELRIQSE